ncbi:biotin-dependent carboxyltransferase family protein [Vibrio astriarenae]
MSLLVKKAHQGVLLQDFGRFGLAHWGITTGGPVDAYAYSWVNRLLNNRANSSIIEITLGQTEFFIQHSAWFAIGGGNLDAQLDGHHIENWSSFYARRGQTLRFNQPKSGLRAYLGVTGGFEVPQTLSSCSTVSRDRLGGLNGDGQHLKSGDTLNFAYPNSKQSSKRQFVSFRFIPDYERPIYLRVIQGYQSSHFEKSAMSEFYNNEYTVNKDSNRMGYRFEGAEIASPNQGILSEGLAIGSIQITPKGLPIVMMADHQTIGGYPKIGCVSQVDLPRLAQAKPGQKIFFQPGNLQELQDAWCRWALFFGY